MGIVQSECSARNRTDFLKLRTAGENFVWAHRLNVADDALAYSCYAITVAFSALLHHCRDSLHWRGVIAFDCVKATACFAAAICCVQPSRLARASTVPSGT